MSFDNEPFLTACRDKVLNDYLVLLAHSAQELNSDHALIALKTKNEELRLTLQTERVKYSDLVDERLNVLDGFFNSENSDIQLGLKEKVKQYMMGKTMESVKTPFLTLSEKIKGYFRNDKQ